ncbi:unnamed protein product [Calicophoron daubneyi]|uniref:CWH43-like N-terminal domain-containing protein n=1 Tax=Calicophoron daubneyi TaxID=300641 RepID=A0AAV2TWU0_CALDB
MDSCTLQYLPISLDILMFGTFATSYSISSVSGNVSVLFPYISETGTLVPESCVFGQLLNLCACLGALCVYVWYLHQMYRIEHNECIRPHHIFARITLAVGMLSALGISIVANFQATSVLSVHLLGAMLAFSGGNVYCILLAYSTRYHLGAPIWLWTLRSLLCFLSVIAHILVPVFARLAGEMRLPPRKYEVNDEGYLFHALSVTFEWVLAASQMIFFLTMTYELRNFTMSSVKVRKTRFLETPGKDTSPS